MYLFVVGNFKPNRRRRQRPATDDIPTAPLLQALLFWTLFGIGALAGAVALTGAIVSEGDSFTRGATAMAATTCVVCFAGSWVMWRRLLR
jgi:hypothetical protein